MFGYSQSKRYEIGIATSFIFKINTIQHTNIRSSPFSTIGLDMAFKINGYDENSVSFLQLAGFYYDRVSYPVEPGNKIITENYFVNINPSILLPSKWNNIKYNIGIGALWYLDRSLVIKSDEQSIGSFSANLDSAVEILTLKSRNVIPFISVGIMWEINNHFKTQISVRQDLLDHFQPNTDLTYYKNREPKQLNINYRPANFTLSFLYFF